MVRSSWQDQVYNLLELTVSRSTLEILDLRLTHIRRR